MHKFAIHCAVASFCALCIQSSWAAGKPASECAPLVRASLSKASALYDKACKGDPDGFWSVVQSQMAMLRATPWESMGAEQVAKIKPLIKREQDALVVDIGKLADKRSAAKYLAEQAKASGSGEDVAKSQKAARILADYTRYYEIRRDVLKSQADYALCVAG